uniref:hypothetical protein n=1 Tax=Acetatifactor sp. TaxID=1872090 RepID=UPI004057B608
MKKVSGKFVLMEIGAILLISFIISLIMAICNGWLTRIDMLMITTIMIGFMIGALYIGFSGLITGKLVNNTIEKNIEKHNFQNCSTFTSSNAIIKIDQRTGRIAYVARQNPFEFQIVSANDIDRIKSDYVKGTFGGTNYVYFEFYYNNKRYRIPTFTSTRQMYSLKSAEVLEGISKADAYAEMLQNAKNAAA